MGDPIHPLIQPVIVNVFFEHVPKRMWATCRLVCKSWHDELLPRWRKQTKVRIGGMGKTDLTSGSIYDDTSDDNKKFMEVPQFLETYQPQDIWQLEKFPFTYVKTIAGQVTIEGSENDIPNKFWSICGPWLHRLHFHGVMINHIKLLENIVFRLTPNLQQLEFSACEISKEVETKINKINRNSSLESYKPGNTQQPNLKIIKISLKSHTLRTYNYITFPLSVLDLFSVFTSVEELCLSEFSHVRKKFVPFLLDVFKTIRETNQNALNIKKLDIKMLELMFTPDSVNKLFALSLPLEELHLQVFYLKKRDDLQRILVNYSNLTKLVLSNETEDDNPEPLNLPTVQLSVLSRTLTHLELLGKVFVDWSFLAYTPNLVTLKVSHDWQYDPTPFPNDYPGNKTPSMKFLTTFYYDCGNMPTIDIVKKFTEIMPKVKELGLSVECDGFEMVCNTWPGLTHWEITYAGMKEATFIANIHKLTSLTCLKVNVGKQINQQLEIMEEFGDESIQRGFLLMSKLKRLCITFPHGITESLLKDLYEKVPDTKHVYFVLLETTNKRKSIYRKKLATMSVKNVFTF